MKRILGIVCLLFLNASPLLISGELPLIYDKEDTGADLKKPPLPDFGELPPIPYLPDPFKKADGARITKREEWRARRAEIKAVIEHYDVGEKPGKPSVLKAKLDGNTILITVGEGDNTFDMTATISRPVGAPDTPIPAIIGINTPTGSQPANLFSSRGIATITFRANEVASTGFGGINYEAGNFMKLYPKSTAGYLIRWAWGVSGLIDALEALPEAKIDVKKLAVSGCSFQGKIALYAGAFDERIALTIPHESGGGRTSFTWQGAISASPSRRTRRDRQLWDLEQLKRAASWTAGGWQAVPWRAMTRVKAIISPCVAAEATPFSMLLFIGTDDTGLRV
jgi:hypothetical protein